MTDISPHSPEARRLLREYLLDTLKPRKRAELDALLAASAEWTEALDAERKALAALDALPQAEVPAHLVDTVMRKVGAAEEARTSAAAEWPSRRIWEWVGVSAIFLVGLAFILLPALPRAREAARVTSSQNNLKQLGIVFKMYESEHPGQAYPPHCPYSDVWMTDFQQLYPEYLTDLEIVIHPKHPDAKQLYKEIREILGASPFNWERYYRLATKSYIYPGWILTGPQDLQLFRERFPKLAPAQYDQDIQAEGRTLYRPRKNLERILTEKGIAPNEARAVVARMPVMFENPDCWKSQRGANVLYFDGHVAFVPLGTFPATPEMAAFFGK